MHWLETVASCPMAQLLNPEDLARELSTVPDWSQSGPVISRTFRFDTYLKGIAFVNEVARLAEEMNHHPDIQIGWRKVTLQLSTHSKGGLTELDFALARKSDAWFA
jgi:4a-hydroxytetrahydrobiopterin dehydratase